MSEKESFGLRLRAARERRGLTLEAIATRTKVSVSLWEAMERNDFSRWPSGLFARSYVRDYATLVGMNAEEVVDEFCRHFPNGDRRRGALVRAHAEVIDVAPQYRDEELPPEGDRRASATPPVPRWAFPGGQRGQRVAGAVLDVLGCIGGTAALCQFVPAAFLSALAVVMIVYYVSTTVVVGQTIGLALAATLARRVPEIAPVSERRLQPTR